MHVTYRNSFRHPYEVFDLQKNCFNNQSFLEEKNAKSQKESHTDQYGIIY